MCVLRMDISFDELVTGNEICKFVINDIEMFDVGLIKGFFVLFLNYYLFNVQYEKNRTNVMQFVDFAIMKWNVDDINMQVADLKKSLKI